MVFNRHGMPLPEHFDEQKWLFLFEKGLISAAHYDAGLRFVGQRPLPQHWQGFMSRLWLYLGLGCLTVALFGAFWLFWPQWPDTWRWQFFSGSTLLLAGIWLLWPQSPGRLLWLLLWLLSMAGALYWLQQQGVAIWLLFSVGVLVLLLLAVYQQSSALWLLFLLTMNASLGFWCLRLQAQMLWSDNILYMLFFSLNMIFFILAEVGWRRDVSGLPRWFLGWIYLFVLTPLLTAAVVTLWQLEPERWYLHDGIPFIPLYLVFATSSLWFYRNIRHDSWILTLILLSLLVFVPMFLYAVFSSIHELTWVVLVSLQAIASVLWLQNTRHFWEKRLLRLPKKPTSATSKKSTLPASGDSL